MNGIYTPIARAVTRPSGDLENLKKFNASPPDLMMVALLDGAKKHIKSNCVYELVYNELSGAIELIEVGEANIGNAWGHVYSEIEMHIGKARTWFSKEEYEKFENKGQ